MLIGTYTINEASNTYILNLASGVLLMSTYKMYGWLRSHDCKLNRSNQTIVKLEENYDY